MSCFYNAGPGFGIRIGMLKDEFQRGNQFWAINVMENKRG
jgi:hypothetical protein